MNKTRLRTLARFLRTVKEEQFDIDTWVGEDLYDLTAEELEAVTNCGFAGCAMGWATRIPSFKKAGLRINEGFLEYKDRSDFGAAAEFLDISYDESHYLFAGHRYSQGNGVTPTMVAERIEEFIKNEQR